MPPGPRAAAELRPTRAKRGSQRLPPRPAVAPPAPRREGWRARVYRSAVVGTVLAGVQDGGQGVLSDRCGRVRRRVGDLRRGSRPPGLAMRVKVFRGPRGTHPSSLARPDGGAAGEPPGAAGDDGRARRCAAVVAGLLTAGAWALAVERLMGLVLLAAGVWQRRQQATAVGLVEAGQDGPGEGRSKVPCGLPEATRCWTLIWSRQSFRIPEGSVGKTRSEISKTLSVSSSRLPKNSRCRG